MEINKNSGIKNTLLAAGILVTSVSFLWEYFFPVTIFYRNIGLAAGAVILTIWAILSILAIREKRRLFKKIGEGTISLVSIIIIGVILIVANLLSYGNNVRIDLTRTGKHTLSEETLKVLSTLETKVKFVGFYQEGSDLEISFRDLLDEYKYRSKKIEYEIFDPDKNPTIAKKYNIKSYNTIVVKMGDKTKEIKAISESSFTNALIQIRLDKKKLLCFMSGHGEKSIFSADTEKNGYSLIKKTLEAKGYEVKNIDLFSTTQIPKNCSVVVIGGPLKDFQENEISELRNFIKTGGSLVLLIDPDYSGRLIDFAKEKDIVFSKYIVANEPSGVFGNDPLITIIKDYGKHPAVSGFPLFTIFPLARPVGFSPSAKKTSPGSTFDKILNTGPSSWIEKNRKTPYRFESYADSKVSVSLGLIYSENVSTEDARAGKILAIGDSEFICNAFLGISGNKDLFVNCINWLAEQEDLIVIPTKSREFSSVNITKSEGNMLFISSVITLPFLILLTGAIIYLKRKKL